MIAAAAALAGCSQFDAALGQREAVVTFTDSATLAQRMAVRTACAKPPNVTPQPLPSNMNSPYALAQVIYQINQASDADVAVLEDVPVQVPHGDGHLVARLQRRGQLTRIPRTTPPPAWRGLGRFPILPALCIVNRARFPM